MDSQPIPATASDALEFSREGSELIANNIKGFHDYAPLQPKSTSTLLIQAIEECRLPTIVDFLADVIDVNADTFSETAMIAACRIGDLACVKKLRNKGATVDNTTSVNTPLLESIRGGHFNIVNYLLEQGVNPNSTPEPPLLRRHTPLALSAYYGHQDMVRLLLQYGADINSQQNPYEKTALMLACEHDHSDVARFLLDQYEIRVGQTCSRGWNELVYASNITEGLEGVVKDLLHLGADIEYESEHNKSILVYLQEAKAHVFLTHYCPAAALRFAQVIRITRQIVEGPARYAECAV
ncbi:ankyrin repeat domain-containing protein [Endozoicomonas sp. SCSIO W0465]|uniref:ankyrin repeat domain-containing protein n=1 Tax=Endozoicomonas sp. SCSIO W0465 TaxID=2918516 RepID=UPI002074F6B7|nr:ankyrin repeat domain-containing protein [Endozoicomonas sp. SCSIO W0465]USE35069.1 ankyrin repeat domain-containing protein [Endozoicomonas sp. SCSIO W0465]